MLYMVLNPSLFVFLPTLTLSQFSSHDISLLKYDILKDTVFYHIPTTLCLIYVFEKP